jgi:hypothetical protein
MTAVGRKIDAARDALFSLCDYALETLRAFSLAQDPQLPWPRGQAAYSSIFLQSSGGYGAICSIADFLLCLRCSISSAVSFVMVFYKRRHMAVNFHTLIFASIFTHSGRASFCGGDANGDAAIKSIEGEGDETIARHRDAFLRFRVRHADGRRNP